jgi:GTPase involved in cell partitioning and DNA repair
MTENFVDLCYFGKGGKEDLRMRKIREKRWAGGDGGRGGHVYLVRSLDIIHLKLRVTKSGQNGGGRETE